MSKEEIKLEINRILDQFSDKALQDLLAFLMGIENECSRPSPNNENFKKILFEDKDLLQKFAK